VFTDSARMDLPVGTAFIVAVIIVIVLAAFIVIVLLAGRRPYFKKRPKPPRTAPVSGGVHQGDPRSVTPSHDEYLEPPQERTADRPGG
jgi:hypothetical protein